MPDDTLTVRWRGKPVTPTGYEDVRALVRIARKLRTGSADFQLHLTPGEVERLREAVHHWGSRVQGRYRAFDARVLAAINRALGDPDSRYQLSVPSRSGGDDSQVDAEVVADGVLLYGSAGADVLLGYAWAATQSEHRVRLGDALAARLESLASGLGWDMAALAKPRLRPVVNAVFGLPLDEGVDVSDQPAPTGTMELSIKGPFGWSRAGELPCLFEQEIAQRCGVYLWTLPIDGVEHVHYVGQTARSFITRTTEHLAAYLSGRYAIPDVDLLLQGEHRLLWNPGSGNAEDGPSVGDFIDRLDSLMPALKKFLSRLRFHLAATDNDPVLLDRIEGTLGRHFQNHPDDRIRSFFGPGVRLPAQVPFGRTSLCRITTQTPIAGLPEEFIV